MKQKKRYIEVQVVSPKPLNAEETRKAVQESVFELFGEEGVSRAALYFKAFNSEKQLALVQCSLLMYPKVLAALALKHSFQNQQISLRSLKTFGTLGKAKPLFPLMKP